DHLRIYSQSVAQEATAQLMAPGRRRSSDHRGALELPEAQLTRSPVSRTPAVSIEGAFMTPTPTTERSNMPHADPAPSLRVGIVGTGGISRSHAPGWLETGAHLPARKSV